VTLLLLVDDDDHVCRVIDQRDGMVHPDRAARDASARTATAS
jgi:hypothetical protein